MVLYRFRVDEGDAVRYRYFSKQGEARKYFTQCKRDARFNLSKRYQGKLLQTELRYVLRELELHRLCPQGKDQMVDLLNGRCVGDTLAVGYKDPE